MGRLLDLLQQCHTVTNPIYLNQLFLVIRLGSQRVGSSKEKLLSSEGENTVEKAGHQYFCRFVGRKCVYMHEGDCFAKGLCTCRVNAHIHTYTHSPCWS